MIFSLWNSIKGNHGEVKQPQLADIKKAMENAAKKDGYVSLTVLDGEFGQDNLSLCATGNNYLVTVYLNTSEDDDKVLPLNNPNLESESMQGLFYKDMPKWFKDSRVEICGN